MARDRSVDRYFFHAAASLIVVAAFHDGVAVMAGKAHRAVFRVVNYRPDARCRFQQGLVARRVKLRRERSFPIFRDARILVELVDPVGNIIGLFLNRFPVADVVVLRDSCIHFKEVPY